MSAARSVCNAVRSLRMPAREQINRISSSRHHAISTAAMRRIPYPAQSSISSIYTQSRAFSVSTPKSHGHVTPPKPGEEIWITFIDKEGVEVKVAASEGDNLLDLAQDNDLEMEGACGGSCACSTCHVIVTDEDMYDRIPECTDDEADMLDLAFGLTETSRLGCQVKMTKDIDGITVRLPKTTRNLQAKDFGA